MSRTVEQLASVYGKHASENDGKRAYEAVPDEHPKRFRSQADTPNERLVTVLQEALDVAGSLDPYLLENASPASASATSLGEATESAPWGELHDAGKTMFRFSNVWTTDLVEAKTLAMFAYMLKAERVLEIGMFTGYGALTIAEALPANGKVVTCEIDPFLKEFSKPHFDKSPHGHKIDVRIGPAIETMKAVDVGREGGFDMVFIDADKGGYQAYYEAALTIPGLLNDGGIIVVDNTLFKGQAYRPIQQEGKDYAAWNHGGIAVRNFNAFVAADPRVEQVLLPIRDGISIVRRALLGNDRIMPVRALSPVPSAAKATVPTPDECTASPLPSVIAADQKDVVFSGVGGKKVLERMRLDGKVALVTGAGQGIGRAFAHALGEAGAALMIVDLELPRAEQVVKELLAKGIRASACCANVAEELEVQAMVEKTLKTFGGLHIAVNNAGVNKNSAAEDTPVSEWDATFGVNTRGVFMCCQQEARHMLKSGGGKIINTASMASLVVPHPQKQAAYNASKSAVVKLTQSLACEWASRGINVNCISPGIVDTPLIWDNEALRPLADKWISDMPIGKLCNVTDLQGAIVYLASEASDYMVGHNLVIEGGQSLW
eukprot:CAMPEP_0183340344 /NCGR_PEP_ID=MMETSP0164_2-20130417/6926_1 /TAXON_ID=221442 /ORGANISM="Coccolithus pelagicus ssp braarudi, Strain PLY182g" /LENGTH=603 /DNA_ID=CAMNT_0025510461 /DNA_START=45 /DNA_END=1856 /DNA_ORIENTATION=-